MVAYAFVFNFLILYLFQFYSFIMLIEVLIGKISDLSKAPTYLSYLSKVFFLSTNLFIVLLKEQGLVGMFHSIQLGAKETSHSLSIHNHSYICTAPVKLSLLQTLMSRNHALGCALKSLFCECKGTTAQ